MVPHEAHICRYFQLSYRRNKHNKKVKTELKEGDITRGRWKDNSIDKLENIRKKKKKKEKFSKRFLKSDCSQSDFSKSDFFKE